MPKFLIERSIPGAGVEALAPPVEALGRLLEQPRRTSRIAARASHGGPGLVEGCSPAAAGVEGGDHALAARQVTGGALHLPGRRAGDGRRDAGRRNPRRRPR